MAALHVAPPPAAADDEIVYESMPCIRIYKNRVERYFGSEFVAASTDAATGVASRDVVISPNVSARLYLPRLEDGAAKLPVLVYYHGGGFCLGSAFNPTFHAYFNSFAALANVLVVPVEYRLAPEHPVPAAYADSWEALAWVVSHLAGPANEGKDPWVAGHADFARLYLGGESAGSNIAHHMAMRVAAEGLPHGAQIRGLVMIHPYFLGTDKVPSDDLDPATRESLGSLWRVMCPATTGEDDPLINPFVDGAPPPSEKVAGARSLGRIQIELAAPRESVQYRRRAPQGADVDPARLRPLRPSPTLRLVSSSSSPIPSFRPLVFARYWHVGGFLMQARYWHIDSAVAYLSQMEVGLALKKLFEDVVVKHEDMFTLSYGLVIRHLKMCRRILAWPLKICGLTT